MLKKLKNKGIAFFITLALLLLLSMAVAVFLITSYNSANINEALARRTRAITLAEAGLHYAYWKIRIGKDDDGSPVDFGDGEEHILEPRISMPTLEWIIRIIVKDDGTGVKTIKSAVDYPKATVFYNQ